MARRKGEPIPWARIEVRYVEGGPEETMRALAQEFSLTDQQVGFYASEHHWSVKRRAYRARLARETSERIFEEKVAIGVDVRLRGVKDRLDHMDTLRELREQGIAVKPMKVRNGDFEEITNHEMPWGTSDHVNYRKAYDEAELGILRALGVESLNFGEAKRVPDYIPTAFLEMMLEERRKAERDREALDAVRPKA